MADNGRGYAYASGLVQSSVDQCSYAWAEAGIYLPPSKCTGAPHWSCGPNSTAFWLNGANWRTDGEFDVTECLSGNDGAWHVHWGPARSSGGGYPKAWHCDRRAEWSLAVVAHAPATPLSVAPG